MNRLQRLINSLLFGEVRIAGSFGIAAGGAVDAAVLRGTGFTVAKVGGGEVGLYRVTLEESAQCPADPGHVAVLPGILSASSGDVAVHVVAADQSTGIFDFQTYKKSDGTDVDPAAACEIHFDLILRNTKLRYDA